jgi:exopolysaccharide biosynthesis polyprenyl glycosylphosphotransferase
MYRRHGQKLQYAFLACDLAVASTAWFGAYFLRFALWAAPEGTPEFARVVESWPWVCAMAGCAYWLCGLYEIHRLQQLPRELGTVCKASGLLFLFAIAVAFYRRDLYESRLAFGLFLLLSTVLLALTRRGVWLAIAWLRTRGLNRGRALVVGCGRPGRMTAAALVRNHWTGLEPVGYVDRPAKVEPRELPRLGDIDELATIVRRYDVDHVFVALPLARYGELGHVYEQLQDALVEIQFVPDVPNLAGMRLRSQEIDGVTFLSLRENPLFGWRVLAKRGMDLACGLTALIALAPVMILLAVLVKLTSAGPVFYRQRRSGLGGMEFDMLKFRSMRIDAEAGAGPVWAVRGDDRCTPLGRFMRQYSLDELPQLFNVLSGDMSLVGPRPERPVFVEQFRRELPNYAWRHQMKAGMTGWAQVNGFRGNTSLRRRLEYDLFYVSNWSIWLDIKILWLTLWCGFRHQNAY